MYIKKAFFLSKKIQKFGTKPVHVPWKFSFNKIEKFGVSVAYLTLHLIILNSLLYTKEPSYRMI